MSLIKTKDEISKIRESGKIVSIVHNELVKMTEPGINLKDLEKRAEELIIENGGRPATKGYEGFPSALCISVNEVMVHGIANNYVLREGDIISYDVVVEKDGWYADACVTVGVGKLDKRVEKLIASSKEALNAAIKYAKPGITLGQLGEYIESFALKYGFTAAENYVGHGIGESMHEEPYVPNFAHSNKMKLKEGMVICIEPMFIDGEDDLFTDPLDKWTVRTKHGGMTTHDEHTVLITKKGGEILTKI